MKKQYVLYLPMGLLRVTLPFLGEPPLCQSNITLYYITLAGSFMTCDGNENPTAITSAVIVPTRRRTTFHSTTST